MKAKSGMCNARSQFDAEQLPERWMHSAMTRRPFCCLPLLPRPAGRVDNFRRRGLRQPSRLACCPYLCGFGIARRASGTAAVGVVTQTRML